ncbi:MAG TPA: ribonuclease P protein component [bacterium]|nr:ribonuclease P protein component [bacterium]
MLTLRKKNDFERVAKFGQPFFVSEFGFKLIKNNLGKNRYGIVISLQVDKKAVVRNKLRRQIKNIIQKNEQKIKQGYDLMFLTKESLKKLNFQEIAQKIDFLYKKSNLWL